MLLPVGEDVGLSKVVAGVGHVRPRRQELRDPEHVAAGGVQQPDGVLVENLLELVGDAVQDPDHVPGVGVVAPDAAHCVVLIASILPLAGVVLLKQILPLFMVL